MNDKTIDLLSLRGKGATPRPTPDTSRGNPTAELNSDEEECPAFGYLRGIRDRALCIEFRFADGRSLAFPYTWLGTMKYQPSAGLLLTFTGDQLHLVLLEGSNLNALVNNAVSLYDGGFCGTASHGFAKCRNWKRRTRGKARLRSVPSG